MQALRRGAVAETSLQSLLERGGISHKDFEEGSEVRSLLQIREELVRHVIKQAAERQVDDMMNTGYDFTGRKGSPRFTAKDFEEIKTAEEHLDEFDRQHAMALIHGKCISL